MGRSSRAACFSLPKHQPARTRSAPSPPPGGVGAQRTELPPGSRPPRLPSAAVLGPSGRVVPVLFFLRCFFLFACGDGGGSSLGLAALEMFGLELRESAVPLAGDKDKESHVQRDRGSPLLPETIKCPGHSGSALPGSKPRSPTRQGRSHAQPCGRSSSSSRPSSGPAGSLCRVSPEPLCTGTQLGRARRGQRWHQCVWGRPPRGSLAGHAGQRITSVTAQRQHPLGDACALGRGSPGGARGPPGADPSPGTHTSAVGAPVPPAPLRQTG